MSEKEYSNNYIIGADECGYGCLAGDLFVVAVKAKSNWFLNGLNDSKKLSENKRLKLEKQLKDLASENQISFALAKSSSLEIDKYGLADCLKLCYVNVISQLYCNNSEVIVDGTLKLSELDRIAKKYNNNNLDLSKINFRSEIKADGKFPTVMAASILGKTARDAEMKFVQHIRFPNYGFDKHVGYGTLLHVKAIEKFGLSDIHRKSYNIKSLKK